MTRPANPRTSASIEFVRGAIATSLLATVSVIMPVFIPNAGATELMEDNPKAVLDEAWQLVNREYVDPTFNQMDWLAVRQRLLSQEYSSTEAAYDALREELQRLNDPYTRFLDPREYSELSDQTAGEVSGVGLELQRDDETRNIYVTAVLENSPAAANGLKAGDRILLVDGQSTERISVVGVARLLRGEESSQVTLTYSRGNSEPRTVILTRARLELPTVAHRLKQVNGYRIGYIRLDEFNGHATEQMVAAIEALMEQNAEAFVLDLRSNPGGLLSASIEISRLWLQRGPIVRTLDRSGESSAISANRTAITDLPMAVLVNNRSASSSEILTGALQDNNRATVVGTTTYGKALVQSLYGLSDGSGLVVTIAHYYTPNGTDINQKGITPDIEVDLSNRQQQELFSNPARLASDQDLQFVQAVTALESTIQSNRTDPNVPSQLGRSPD
ncbi:S41 family peptidase [Oscillatoria sp. CS-180]|uniref:S41 family peptidase n=1 Tax=Oscillatoria sp. CS-180 TaxID=3021720 RepID=UPI00232DA92D|nr:S41 family peptidase [Oscillatoria sp. CS-180]MDB9529894.1 S41 family peptidase [Oscillatoria sp. CS-180]